MGVIVFPRLTFVMELTVFIFMTFWTHISMNGNSRNECVTNDDTYINHLYYYFVAKIDFFVLCRLSIETLFVCLSVNYFDK